VYGHGDDHADATIAGGLSGAIVPVEESQQETSKEDEDTDMQKEVTKLFETVKRLGFEISELDDRINELVSSKTESPLSPARAEDAKKDEEVVDEDAKKADEVKPTQREERETRRMKRTLYGRVVLSDFFRSLSNDGLDDDEAKEVKEELDEFIKEEVSDFLDEEFSKLDSTALLNVDLSETKIDRELKNLDRKIRELKRSGRQWQRGTENEAQEKKLKLLAIQLYAAKRMKSKIESGVEKRFRAVRDNLIAVQTRSDEIKAQEERMTAMAKMFQESDPTTKMLLLEMFGDPMMLSGGASPGLGTPQGFSLDIGSSPGGGLRVGLGAQGAESGFSLNGDFSPQPKDPFSRMFPNYLQNGGYNYEGFNPSFDPRRFGGSYWGN
jgi:hypothetical protein